MEVLELFRSPCRSTGDFLVTDDQGVAEAAQRRVSMRDGRMRAAVPELLPSASST
jgi:predicted ABC-type transport system involved in lysophospholipase L1 biosynthesis ATPase subunit